ncbi:MAG: hypothetical protein VR68_04225 [Peptococcaceae bacterium BRH_c4a]|nr:MAG: hypothetical protein VR68_04225 [Peptococcaceae bacterium BRH_c4a]
MVKFKTSYRTKRKIHQRVIMGIVAAVLSLGLLASSMAGMLWSTMPENTPLGDSPQQATAAELEEKDKAAPNDVNILQELALAYEREGQAAKASETYEKAVSLAPEREDLKTRLAGSLISVNQYDRAAAMLQELIAKNPNNKEAHYFYGHALVAKRKYEKATAEFEQYIKLAGENDPQVENVKRLVEALKPLVKK